MAWISINYSAYTLDGIYINMARSWYNLYTLLWYIMVMRIGTQGTTPHGLGWPREGSNTTRPIIQEIREDRGMFPKV
jgi:hypothetical protein